MSPHLVLYFRLWKSKVILAAAQSKFIVQRKGLLMLTSCSVYIIENYFVLKDTRVLFKLSVLFTFLSESAVTNVATRY